MRLDEDRPRSPPSAPLAASGASDGELSRFRSRTPGSLLEWERARRHLPAGVCSNFRLMDPHPIFLRSARGSRVQDVDGNEYVDWGMAQSTLLSGHAHPHVHEAVRRQMESGTLTCYPNPRTADLAKIVCERFPLDLSQNSGPEPW